MGSEADATASCVTVSLMILSRTHRRRINEVFVLTIDAADSTLDNTGEVSSRYDASVPSWLFCDVSKMWLGRIKVGRLL